MKKTFLFALLMFSSTILLGQTAYIQVNGEPNLSVYLNGKFKAKTTADLEGCIIENVTPGKNLIKIVKEGYTPFEETITVKDGEVLAYKVKPFAKHKVYVSEQGNTEETDKKETVKTGKLIVQSVPIGIKITIPSIEGVTNNTKTKDEWIIDNIPVGSSPITFIFNKKVITKSFEIIEGETTSLFVNMLSGDFKSSNSLEDKRKGEQNFMSYTYFKYYSIGLTLEEAKIKYPEYYKKYDTYKYKDQTQFDRAYSSKISGLYIYGKNGKIVGCSGKFQGRVEDDSSFTKGNKAVSDFVNELKKEFQFNPKETSNSYNQDGYKYDTVTYTWEKNEKSLSISYVKWYFSNGYTTEITLTQFDPQ